MPTAYSKRIDLTRLASSQHDGTLIGRNDVLKVTLVSGYEDHSEPSMPARVSEAGTIDLPVVGTIPVEGLRPSEAEQVIARYAIERGVYSRPHVTVTIERPHVNHVTVVGAVESPGMVELDRSSSDLLGALAEAGGLTETAGTEIQVLRTPRSMARRTGASGVQQASYTSQATRPAGSSLPALPAAQRVDLAELSQGLMGDFNLDDGDVVMVYEDEPRSVYVMGLVRDAQKINITPGQDLRVLDALAQAGGRQIQFADKVTIVRKLDHLSEPVLIQVSVREAKEKGAANLLLAANDVVTVEETPATFVLGTLQQFFRFGLSGAVPLF